MAGVHDETCLGRAKLPPARSVTSCGFHGFALHELATIPPSRRIMFRLEILT